MNMIHPFAVYIEWEWKEEIIMILWWYLQRNDEMRLDGDGVCWQWIFPSQCLLPSLFHQASQCPSLLFHPHISHNVQASYPILISPHQEGNPASKLVRFGVFLWIFSSLHPHSDSSQYKGFPGLESVKTYFQFAWAAFGLRTTQLILVLLKSRTLNATNIAR